MSPHFQIGGKRHALILIPFRLCLQYSMGKRVCRHIQGFPSSNHVEFSQSPPLLASLAKSSGWDDPSSVER